MDIIEQERGGTPDPTFGKFAEGSTLPVGRFEDGLWLGPALLGILACGPAMLAMLVWYGWL